MVNLKVPDFQFCFTAITQSLLFIKQPYFYVSVFCAFYLYICALWRVCSVNKITE